ncbi:hypothetical protein [Frankia sp. CiP3]|uniref:hypothetical protein n=1 Tax=Frankia sp. CiP3 TaxID=2880971 RepID=UPI001EF716C3|nr:hypothetical protein [Frankia sp. CiP3]
MGSSPMTRTQYFNVATGTVRTGSTTHGESLTDVENGLLPLARWTESSLHSWGVADGLTVTATMGQQGVTVSPGVALDSLGRVVALAPGGVAVIDPAADPSQVVNIATVPVGATGVTVATDGLGPATLLLTALFREVQDQGQAGVPPVLLHAPWLRLRVEASVPDDGPEVVLARVTLDAGNAVAALEATRRRLAGLPAGRIELRRPVVGAGATPAIGQQAAAVLAVPDSGGLSLTGSAGGPTVSLLSIDASLTAASLLPGGGRLVLGTAGPPRTILHVEGNEGVHSGGTGGGFSFADRAVGGFVPAPGAGERWVWYASGETARLWSGRDVLTIGTTGEGLGLDVARRMRVRQGGDASAGLWFFQDGTASDRAFVGMANDAEVGFFGAGVGWGLKMDVNSGDLRFAGDYGRPDGPSTLSLWGSRIGDVGNGTLFLRSGGGAVAFDGGDGVQIGTAGAPGSLAVQNTGTAISATNSGDSLFAAAVFANGMLGVLAQGRTTGVFASGRNVGVVGVGPTAGQFFGDVSISGTLSKGGGGFRIDHPLNPENKYLSHSFVESPEMLNVYRGTVTTDDAGDAAVELPDYVEALNEDFTYHLTVLGEIGIATVTRPVQESGFRIRSDRPGVEVCWLLLGVRRDPWANEHRIQVEEDKDGDARGRYLHPDVRGGGPRLFAHPEHEKLLARNAE